MYGSFELGALFGELFEHKKSCVTTVCMMGDTGQLTPMGAGVPFENLTNSHMFASGCLTIVHRTETTKLSSFCNGYRKCLDPTWCFFNMTNTCKSDDFSEVQLGHLDCNGETEILQTYERALLRIKAFYSIDEIMTITFSKRYCTKLSHIHRKVFRPEHEQTRLETVQKLTTARGMKDDTERKWGQLAPGDKVCFTSNCRWYKNGDETTVLSEKYTELKHGFVQHRCTVDFTADESIHKVLQLYLNSKADPDSNHWLTVEDVPADLSYVDKYRYTISLASDKLKTLSCITAHKSQGDQAKCVVFVVPTYFNKLDCRNYYTPTSRAQRQLFLIGPVHAFSTEGTRVQLPLPNTILQILTPNKDSCTKTGLDTTEQLYNQKIIQRYCHINSQSLRLKTWTRDCKRPNTESVGACLGCKCSLSADEGWHLCQNGANAVDESSILHWENVYVSCQACNLKAHVQNLCAYKKKLSHLKAVAATQGDNAQRVLHYIESENQRCIGQNWDYMRSENALVLDFIRQQNDHVPKNEMTDIIQNYVELGRLERYTKSHNGILFSTLKRVLSSATVVPV